LGDHVRRLIKNARVPSSLRHLTEKEHPMRVIVDPDLCEANGFCESLAPRIFELGDSDVVQIADGPVPEDLEIDARAAVDQCPKAALRIFE
jgi:ferredoxin